MPKKLERARKQAFPLKQLQQPSGAGLEEALADRWRHDRAGVDQQLGARAAGEPPLSLWVAGVTIGAGGDSQQAAVIVVAVPGKQRRVFTERCSMRAAGPARTLFTSPRWDCRFWANCSGIK